MHKLKCQIMVNTLIGLVTQEEIGGLRFNTTYRQIGAEGVNEEVIESEKAKNWVVS